MADERMTEAAVAAHDLQRWLPEEAERALIEGLRDRLAGLGRCLDAGVGTGAIALPLARAGVPLVGVDHSRAMLDATVAKAGGRAPFPLVRGDLVRLPFGDGSFGAAIAANVFHLVAAWREAVAEAVRVVRPGGLLLVNLGAVDRSGLGAAVRARFRELLGEADPPEGEAAGPRDAAEFEAVLVRHGVAALAPLEVRAERWWTPEQAIARLEHNPFAWSIGIDPAALRAAGDATRAWAERHVGPLDEPRRSEHVVAYRTYRV